MIKYEFHKDQEKDLDLGLVETGGEGQKHSCVERYGDWTGTDERDHGTPNFLVFGGDWHKEMVTIRLINHDDGGA